ncbi:MAG: NUDIX hydrolase [Granulosicoccus sp.]
MSKWRPVQAIQVKVIGLCVHQGSLLAGEVVNDDGSVKGVRPLGGLIEFGETRGTAIEREFREELDTDIICYGKWLVFENLYIHGGKRGHEIVFAIEVELVDRTLYDRELIVFSEDSGADCTARWYPIDELKSGSVELYPDGLLEALSCIQAVILSP